MYRYGIELSYRGDAFNGWQRQPNAYTVQQELEDKLRIFIPQAGQMTGCGRTDTGVHARYYAAHIDLHSPIEDIRDLIFHWNAVLHKHVVVHNIYPVAVRWNARYYATSREYRYFISRKKNPFWNEFSWYFPHDLDMNSMQIAASYLEGRHDFSGFMKTKGGQKSGICTVEKMYLHVSDDFIVFQIIADRFLRAMVRLLVGTLIEVGKGHFSPSVVQEVLSTQKRPPQMILVPANGLFLWNVTYPDFPPVKEGDVKGKSTIKLFPEFMDEI